MSKSNFLETQFIDAIFASGAVSPLATVYVSLHTADPLEGGDQTTNEATFTPYARQPILNAEWTVGQDNATNANDIVRPEATAGTESLTHFGVGDSLSGAGNLFYFGVLSAQVDVSPGVTVKVNAGNLTVTED